MNNTSGNGNQWSRKGQFESSGSGSKEGTAMTDTMWQCEQWRAGQVLSKILFHTKAEAEKFCLEMRRAEPDIFWRMEPVEARLVWN